MAIYSCTLYNLINKVMVGGYRLEKYKQGGI